MPWVAGREWAGDAVPPKVEMIQCRPRGEVVVMFQSAQRRRTQLFRGVGVAMDRLLSVANLGKRVLDPSRCVVVRVGGLRRCGGRNKSDGHDKCRNKGFHDQLHFMDVKFC